MSNILLVRSGFDDNYDLGIRYSQIIDVVIPYLDDPSIPIISIINNETMKDPLNEIMRNPMNASMLKSKITAKYSMDIKVDEHNMSVNTYIQKCVPKTIKLIIFINRGIRHGLIDTIGDGDESMRLFSEYVAPTCKILFWDKVDTYSDTFAFISIDNMLENQISSNKSSLRRQLSDNFYEYRKKIMEIIEKPHDLKQTRVISDALTIIRELGDDQLKQQFITTYDNMTTDKERIDILMKYDRIFFDNIEKCILSRHIDKSIHMKPYVDAVDSFNKFFWIDHRASIINYIIKKDPGQSGGIVNNKYNQKITYYTHKLNKYKSKKTASMINKY
jgi:hypothetical protein